jgi:hypothetical protein
VAAASTSSSVATTPGSVHDRTSVRGERRDERSDPPRQRLTLGFDPKIEQ